ncbi:MAG: hypothetical protein KIS96_07885 [Bauldia sp.]|nr:hypothetical protein [Bauldia sp.]
MTTVDLSRLRGDQIVIHYGGALTSVDAYTFANSLVAFADAARAVNAVINPGQNIEIRIEALGDGSFRAVVKRITKGIGGFFSKGVQPLFWGVIGTLLYDIADPSEVQIVIEDDQVVIEHGGDRIIVPREVYDMAQQARADPEVQRNIRRTIEVLEPDPAIENFGLTPEIDDPEPLVQVPRSRFAMLTRPPELSPDNPTKREHRERARLVILKAWLKKGRHKWQFEWNGVPLSAPIEDQEFLDRLARREYLLGAGDALDVLLRVNQDLDEALGVYVNDQSTFIVEKVFRVVPQTPQALLPDQPEG